MDQKQIEDIVRSVMASMGQPQSQPQAPAASTPACHAACASEAVVESCALDLGSAEAKAWIGVQHPHRAEVLTELKRSTAARVCTGRAGPRPRTQALLRFLADHSRSKDTVLKEVPEAWVKAQGLLEVRSEISDKNLYLTRPDMGRRLSPEAIDALKAQCVMDPDVQVVVSDGLSTDAITANYEEILPPLLAGLKQAGLKVGARPVGEPLLLRGVLPAGGDHRRGRPDLYLQYPPGRHPAGRSRRGDRGFSQTHAGAESLRHQHEPLRRHHASIRFDSTLGHRDARDCLGE